MLKSLVSLLCLCVTPLSAAGQVQQQPQKSDTGAPGQTAPGFITPAEVNVRIEPDARMFVVMAALNAAGFDYEPGGQPLSPARAELRKDLANLDPQIKAKLAAFYRSHRRPGVEESADAARYAALSLLMTQPPAFSIYQSSDHPLPQDLQAILADVDASGGPLFLSLLRDFYVKSGIRELIPKYTAIGQAYASAYRRPVGETIYQVLEYFHVRPETVIKMRPLIVSSNTDKTTKAAPTVFARNRTRQVFVIPDPLTAIGASFVRGDILNQKEDILARRVGDDYIVVVGPSRVANSEAVRNAMIRFVIDPMIERRLKDALEYKDQIVKLVAGVPTATSEYSSSVYLVFRESLAQATEIRMRRLQALAAGGSYSEDDAGFDLVQAYTRGAVLVFHFYNSLVGYEKVGISIEDAYDQMVATIKFDREGGRAKEFEPVVTRVSAARRSGSSKAEAGTAAATIASKILISDDLIRQRRFSEARGILDEILAAAPNNARALYGMAQVVNQTPSNVELDPKADENDKIQAQHDRLEQAIMLYRKAIQSASPESENWLIQWCHVFLGRVFDFQEFRADAVVEYEAAIALGEVKNGAYKEALEGKRRPYGQKN